MTRVGVALLCAAATMALCTSTAHASQRLTLDQARGETERIADRDRWADSDGTRVGTRPFGCARSTKTRVVCEYQIYYLADDDACIREVTVRLRRGKRSARITDSRDVKRAGMELDRSRSAPCAYFDARGRR